MMEVEADRFNHLRTICLENVDHLLMAAACALELGIDHVAFHLATLALEEMGKITLSAMKLVPGIRGGQEEVTLDFEDHEKKLFWAIWGPFFGKERITKAQIEEKRGLAKTIHDRRKRYLYVDPANPVSWKSIMQPGEAKKHYDLVCSAAQLMKAQGGMKTAIPEDESAALRWFLLASEDLEKKREIFSSKSQDRLIELGSMIEWIKWLKATDEKNQREMQALTKAELNREAPEDPSEAMKPKWTIRLRITTPSHSIRDRPLHDFNNSRASIKLHKSDVNTLIMEITIPKVVTLGSLYLHGWGMARTFIASLNIATGGFFWWNVPRDISKYYEEIIDLETGNRVVAEMRPRLTLDWKKHRLVLGPSELMRTARVFRYLSYLIAQERTEALDHYTGGLTFLAKNDIHFRVEREAFREFFKAFQVLSKAHGQSDGRDDLKSILHKQIDDSPQGELNDADRLIDLGFDLETEQKSSKAITLTEVYGIKLYGDLYFAKAVVDYFKTRPRKSTPERSSETTISK